MLTIFVADPDPGSGAFLTLAPGSEMEKLGSGIRDKHPGSATLQFSTTEFTVYVRRYQATNCDRGIASLLKVIFKYSCWGHLIFPSLIPEPGPQRPRIPDPDPQQRIQVFSTTEFTVYRT